jgi:hypothetical protein
LEFTGSFGVTIGTTIVEGWGINCPTRPIDQCEFGVTSDGPIRFFGGNDAENPIHFLIGIFL